MEQRASGIHPTAIVSLCLSVVAATSVIVTLFLPFVVGKLSPPGIYFFIYIPILVCPIAALAFAITAKFFAKKPTTQHGKFWTTRIYTFACIMFGIELLIAVWIFIVSRDFS